MQTHRAATIAVVEDATARTSAARAAAQRQRCRLDTLLTRVQRLAAMQRQLEALSELEAMRDLLLDQTDDLALIEQLLDVEIGCYRQTRRQL